MNRFVIFFLFILGSLSCLGSNSSDKQVTLLKSLIKSNKTYNRFQSKEWASFMENFRGDTLQFNISGTQFVNNFKIENPDTIWLRDRPKKNPKEGKHYILNHFYKGVQINNKFATPISEINGKKFGILSVRSAKSKYYGFEYGVEMRILDFENLEVVNVSLPDMIPYEVIITSSRKDSAIKSLEGHTFLVKGFATSYIYQPVILKGGSYRFILDEQSQMPFKSELDLTFVDDNGSPIDIYTESFFYKYSSTEILSTDEYEANIKPHNINSKINIDLINDSTAIPFDFTFIKGRPKDSNKYLSQTINPVQLSENNWHLGCKTIPDDNLLIGGSLTIKDKKFYKTIYNGKAFFARAEDIKLSEDGKLQLDSLENTSAHIQDIFFHRSLYLSNAWYIHKLEKALNDVKSYTKYGLAIMSFKLYDESEYTEGTGVNITFFNPTPYEIKYISFTLQGFNDVDDPVGSCITKRCIGPIKPDETGSYEFSYVWFTDIVKYSKIRSITVTYKNGSSKTINNPQNIMLSNEVNKTIFGNNPVESLN